MHLTFLGVAVFPVSTCLSIFTTPDLCSLPPYYLSGAYSCFQSLLHNHPFIPTFPPYHHPPLILIPTIIPLCTHGRHYHISSSSHLPCVCLFPLPFDIDTITWGNDEAMNRFVHILTECSFLTLNIVKQRLR